MPLLAEIFSARAVSVQIGFGCVVLAIAVTLAISNRRTWLRIRNETLSDDEMAFFDRQFRRRNRVNLMIGGVALAIGAGVVVREPIPMLLYWVGVILIVLWIGVLGLFDWFSTQAFYRKLRTDQLVKKAALEAEIQRMRESKGNGQPRGS